MTSPYTEALVALRKELAESRAAHHRTSHKAVKRLRALWREKQAAESRVSALSAEVERLKTAISWIEPPFVDENTSVEELRHRVVLCVTDAKRAALGGSDYG